jgi:hypothetical protein
VLAKRQLATLAHSASGGIQGFRVISDKKTGFQASTYHPERFESWCEF